VKFVKKEAGACTAEFESNPDDLIDVTCPYVLFKQEIQNVHTDYCSDARIRKYSSRPHHTVFPCRVVFTIVFRSAKDYIERKEYQKTNNDKNAHRSIWYHRMLSTIRMVKVACLFDHKKYTPEQV